MWEKLINDFKNLNKLYVELINLTETKFVLLKTQELSKINEIEKEEKLKLYDIGENTKEVVNQIEKISDYYGVKDEIKLKNIIEKAEEKERLELMACQQDAINNERKLKNNLKMNECLALAFMETNKTILETAVYIANEENGGGKLFINKEL